MAGVPDKSVTRTGISREELVDLLCQLLSGFASQLLRPGISDSWARLLIREQMDPTEEFTILYSVMRLVTEGTASIVGKILGAPKDSEDVRIRTMALLGQAIVFRSHRAAALRFVGWKSLGSQEILKVQSVVSNQCGAILRASIDAARGDSNESKRDKSNGAPQFGSVLLVRTLLKFSPLLSTCPRSSARKKSALCPF
jgi:HTH-type transcriptional dual regulator CecR, C-terminal domain